MEGKKAENFKTLIGENEDKRPLEKPCSKWLDKKKIDLKEIGHEGVAWIYVV